VTLTKAEIEQRMAQLRLYAEKQPPDPEAVEAAERQRQHSVYERVRRMA
jgi:predicted secreted protein